jgi:hypothetical protein
VLDFFNIVMYSIPSDRFDRLSAFSQTASSGPSLCVIEGELLPILKVVAAHGIGTYTVRRFMTARLIEMIGIEEDLAAQVRDAVTSQVENVSVVLLPNGIANGHRDDVSVEGEFGIGTSSQCEPEPTCVQSTLF